MRRFTSRLCLLVVIASGGSAYGQPPKKPQTGKLDSLAKPTDHDRELFLLYLLEDCYRDTKVGDGPNQLPPDSATLQRFITNRRAVVDQVINGLEAANAKDPLIDLFLDYRKELKRIEKYQAEVAQRQAAYYAPIKAAWQQLEEKLRIKRLMSLADTYEKLGPSVVEAAGRPHGRWFDAALVASMFADMTASARVDAARIVETRKTQKQVNEYVTANRDNLETDLREIAGKYTGEQLTTVARSKEYASRRAKEKGWFPTEMNFEPDRDISAVTAAEQPRNPFPYKWRAQAFGSLDQDDPANIRAAHRAAADCLYAAEVITPAGPGSRLVKAALSRSAGELANRAAAAKAATGGFVSVGNLSKDQKPGATAVQAWAQYKNYESVDFLDKEYLLHQRVIAQAYNGGRYTAFTMIVDYLKKSDNLPLVRPETWYDFARVCALTPEGSKLWVNGPSAQDLAVFCLERARMYGMSEVEQLSRHPDLSALAKNKAAAVNKALTLPVLVARGSSLAPAGVKPPAGKRGTE